MKAINLFKRISGKAHKMGKRSMIVSDKLVIEAFTANSDNTFLVSFPRTGSHWLRMVTELYFGRPSLVRVFYYPKRKDYLMLHTHDLELDVVRSNVIYLYRNPVDTIFSLLNYHQESIDDRQRIAYWADLYGRHLDKWLHQECFTKRKTILTYEGMKDDLAHEFEKVVVHFGQNLDRKRLKDVAIQVTKDEVKSKTKDDPQVIQSKAAYDADRELFSEKQSQFIWEVLTTGRPHLNQGLI